MTMMPTVPIMTTKAMMTINMIMPRKVIIFPTKKNGGLFVLISIFVLVFVFILVFVFVFPMKVSPEL